MKFTLSILSALMVAMPVISSELLYPTTILFAQNWEGATLFSVVNDSLSAIDKVRESVLEPLHVLKFNQTGESASITVEREVWKGDYYYKCKVTVAQDPRESYVQISFSGGDDEFNYKVDKHENEVKIECDKVEGGKAPSAP